MTASGRDWQAAHWKTYSEGKCRNCRAECSPDPAHIVPRSTGLAGVNDARNILPLCRPCHDAQHRGELALGPLLTGTERAYVIALVGEGEASRRLRGSR